MGWQSREALADSSYLREQDSLAALRGGLRRVSEMRDEWAGIPMPIQGHGLVVEPRYPKAAELMAMFRDAGGDSSSDGWSVRNTFYSKRLASDVVVMAKDGRVEHGVVPSIHHLKQDLQTLGASVAWGIEQESAALQLLGTLVTPHAFKQYLLTGMFLETSKRSRITYVFRRLKPTVALRAQKEPVRILCTLCLHPIAHYEESWAGAMCPTDDVIAHLSLMRGDEAMFWRRANQHPAHRPEAGL